MQSENIKTTVRHIKKYEENIFGNVLKMLIRFESHTKKKHKSRGAYSLFLAIPGPNQMRSENMTSLSLYQGVAI